MKGASPTFRTIPRRWTLPRMISQRMAGVRGSASCDLVTFHDSAGTLRVGELEAEQVYELAAGSMLEWLAGEGRERTGVEHPLARRRPDGARPRAAERARLLRLRGARRRRLAAARRRDPRVLVRGAGLLLLEPGRRSTAPARRSPARTDCEMLDFELEIAAVIDARGEIAGFTLMNDWSARDFQMREMTVGLGPHKGKDFATSLGPVLVTPDELPYEDGRLQLEATRRPSTARRSHAATPPRSTSRGRRSSSRRRATRTCARRRARLRARSGAAACSSSARSTASAGSSPATSSRSTRRGSGPWRRRWFEPRFVA